MTDLPLLNGERISNPTQQQIAQEKAIEPVTVDVMRETQPQRAALRDALMVSLETTFIPQPHDLEQAKAIADNSQAVKVLADQVRTSLQGHGIAVDAEFMDENNVSSQPARALVEAVAEKVYQNAEQRFYVENYGDDVLKAGVKGLNPGPLKKDDMVLPSRRR